MRSNESPASTKHLDPRAALAPGFTRLGIGIGVERLPLRQIRHSSIPPLSLMGMSQSVNCIRLPLLIASATSGLCSDSTLSNTSCTYGATQYWESSGGNSLHSK